MKKVFNEKIENHFRTSASLHTPFGDRKTLIVCLRSLHRHTAISVYRKKKKKKSEKGRCRVKVRESVCERKRERKGESKRGRGKSERKKIKRAERKE